MTTTQLTGMRNLWEASTKAAETMTAREMALMPHSLSSKATFATLTNGTRYVWHDSLQLWVRY